MEGPQARRPVGKNEFGLFKGYKGLDGILYPFVVDLGVLLKKIFFSNTETLKFILFFKDKGHVVENLDSIRE